VTSRDETTAGEPQTIYLRKCWNCGQPATDNDLRVCDDPICGQAAISQRARVQEKVQEAELRKNEYARNYMRERRKCPEVRERQREYHREYYQRPEVKERERLRKRESRRRPEVKEQEREYYQRPEVKERMRKYQRERYHRLKQLREEE